MTDTNVLASPDLQHFLALARSGDSDGCAEVAANTLATSVLDHVCYFDESALRGLCTFIGLAKLAPHTATKLLEQQ